MKNRPRNWEARPAAQRYEPAIRESELRQPRIQKQRSGSDPKLFAQPAVVRSLPPRKLRSLFFDSVFNPLLL
jgi:hypothetical protein